MYKIDHAYTCTYNQDFSINNYYVQTSDTKDEDIYKPDRWTVMIM